MKVPALLVVYVVQLICLLQLPSSSFGKKIGKKTNWKWAGAYKVKRESYRWQPLLSPKFYDDNDRERKENAYGVVLSMPECTEEFLELTIPEANKIFSSASIEDATNFRNNSENGYSYFLKYGMALNRVALDEPTYFHSSYGDCFAFFFDIDPIDENFEFVDKNGDIQMVAVDMYNEEGFDYSFLQVYLYSILAVALVSLTSLVGILFATQNTGTKEEKIEALKSRISIGNAFAAGAIVGTAFIHILPEGHSFLTELDEEKVAWQSGTVCIAGILTGLLIHMFSGHDHEMPHAHGHGHHHSESHHHHADEEIDDKENGSEILLNPEQHKEISKTSTALCDTSGVKAKAWSLIYGCMFHNMIDGIMIGAAFKGCGSTGWLVTGAICLHEVPAEIGDFFVLCHSGMTVSQALFYNLLSSLTAFIGLGVVLLNEEISGVLLGFVLIYGAGIFIYIGCVEILPGMLDVDTMKTRVLNLFLFIVGCVMVSIPLLFHMHCETTSISGSSHDHHGHDHGHGHSH